MSKEEIFIEVINEIKPLWEAKGKNMDFQTEGSCEETFRIYTKFEVGELLQEVMNSTYQKINNFLLENN